MMRVRHLLLAAMLPAAMPCLGQWGVRGTVLHFEQQTRRGNFNWSLGLDRDLNDRSGIGLDLISQIDLSGDGGVHEQTQHEGFTVSYSMVRKVTGLQYRSFYFLSDRGGSGVYIGTQVGFRRIVREVDPLVFSTGGATGTPSWARRVSDATMVFPVGLRLGLRGELDGFFGDLYVAVGYQIGGGGKDRDLRYLADKDQLAGLSIQAGYAIGIGW